MAFFAPSSGCSRSSSACSARRSRVQIGSAWRSTSAASTRKRIASSTRSRSRKASCCVWCRRVTRWSVATRVPIFVVRFSATADSVVLEIGSAERNTVPPSRGAAAGASAARARAQAGRARTRRGDASRGAASAHAHAADRRARPYAAADRGAGAERRGAARARRARGRARCLVARRRRRSPGAPGRQLDPPSRHTPLSRKWRCAVHRQQHPHHRVAAAERCGLSLHAPPLPCGRARRAGRLPPAPLCRRGCGRLGLARRLSRVAALVAPLLADFLRISRSRCASRPGSPTEARTHEVGDEILWTRSAWRVETGGSISMALVAAARFSSEIRKVRSGSRVV